MSSSINTRKDKIQDIIGKYRNAGEISRKAKSLAREICKPGANVYDICQSIESFFRKEGAKPAFPTNISINNEAAHYSAEILDKRVIPENSIVKIDLGAHIDGYIVDTAITINFNPDLEELTQSSLTALEKAIDASKSGVKVSKIGSIIEHSIMNDGFQPVRNLSGHQIKRYNLHAGVSIPNCGPGYFERDSTKLKVGRIYAIEPFASTGKGWIKNANKTNIFRFIRKPKKKQNHLVDVYKEYMTKVGVLPFSPRMLHDPKSANEGKQQVMANIHKLMKAKLIMGYPVLIEETSHAMISQYEHTIRITKNGAELLT